MPKWDDDQDRSTVRPPLEVRLQPISERYAEDDERWLAQVNLLRQDLRREVPDVRGERESVPGAKGSVEQLVWALGSAGAFPAALGVFRAWLARDRTRRLVVTWRDDSGDEQRVTVDGEGLDRTSLQAVAQAAAARLGEAPWPTSATAPS